MKESDTCESKPIQQRHNKQILSTHRFYQRLEKRAGDVHVDGHH